MKEPADILKSSDDPEVLAGAVAFHIILSRSSRQPNIDHEAGTAAEYMRKEKEYPSKSLDHLGNREDETEIFSPINRREIFAQKLQRKCKMPAEGAEDGQEQ